MIKQIGAIFYLSLFGLLALDVCTFFGAILALIWNPHIAILKLILTTCAIAIPLILMLWSCGEVGDNE